MKNAALILAKFGEKINLDLFYVITFYKDKISMQGYVSMEVFEDTGLTGQVWGMYNDFFRTIFHFEGLKFEIFLSAKP